MKTGKVSQTVLKRSILKQINKRRPEIIHGASLRHDCPALQFEAGEVTVMSTCPTIFTPQDVEMFSVNRMVNDLVTSGACPVGMTITMLLPTYIMESDLKQMMRNFDLECEKQNIQIIGGHTEFTDSVNRPIISLTGVGKVPKDKLLSIANSKPGQDIVMTKSIGMEGTYLMALAKKELLEERFSPNFIRKVMELRNELSVVNEAAVAIKHGVTAMHDITTGGIFGALWEIGSAANLGIEADLKCISVKQETIEICELFGINPYQLLSGGSLLMITDDGNGLIKELNKEKIHASLIGKITQSNDRIVVRDEEIRYLEPPKEDEIYKI